jgi:hypothetical protein
MPLMDTLTTEIWNRRGSQQLVQIISHLRAAVREAHHAAPACAERS